MKKYNIGDIVNLCGSGCTNYYTVIGIRTSKTSPFDPDYALVESNILSPSIKYVPECIINEKVDVVPPNAYALNEELYGAIMDYNSSYCNQRLIESGNKLKFIMIDYDDLMELYRKQ